MLITDSMSNKKDWIVTFRNDLDPQRFRNLNGIKVKEVYQHAINGICCSGSKKDVKKHFNSDAIHSYVKDSKVQIQTIKDRKILTKEYLTNLKIQNFSTQTIEAFITRIGANHSSQKSGDNIGSLENRNDINVFVVDTGIALHPELNIVGGRNFTNNDSNAWQDKNGHGTHVSGIIGAKDNSFGIVGVAPGVRLWAVKVLGDNGSGTVSSVISGLNWILQNRGVLWNGHGIVNMSLGGGPNVALDNAVNNLLSKGIVVCIAAGNSNINVSYVSPARVVNAITVGATMYNPTYNYLASYSNYGSGVAILAPGSNIYSTYLSNNYAVLSGTSMAAPIASGTVALLLSIVKVAGYGTLTFALNVKNMIKLMSSYIRPINYDKTLGYNPRIYVPIKKPTTNVSIWSGGY